MNPPWDPPPWTPPLGGEGIKGTGLPFDSIATWVDSHGVFERGEPRWPQGKVGRASNGKASPRTTPGRPPQDPLTHADRVGGFCNSPLLAGGGVE